MAEVRLQGPDGALENPTLVEGFPGVGLVGKIATDHLVDEFDMELYGTVHCDSLAPIGVYHEGERTIQPPVRIYAAPDEDLVALQSDIPVNSAAVAEFADCLVSWLDEENVTPIFLSGLPAEKSGVPELFGIATGDAGGQLDDVDIDGREVTRSSARRRDAIERRLHADDRSVGVDAVVAQDKVYLRAPARWNV